MSVSIMRAPVRAAQTRRRSEDCPLVGAMSWAVATLTPGGQVEGMIGPFGSQSVASTYARAHCQGTWAVAPMLRVTAPDEAPIQ
ncbi:hypothetical protein FAGKG844_400047 [Frankia sp. AgKG'84/4]